MSYISMRIIQYRRPVIWLLFTTLLSCSGTTTDDLLTGEFIDEPISLRLTVTQSLIESQRTFIIDVTAIGKSTSAVFRTFDRALQATASGAGLLTIEKTEAWQSGSTKLHLQYAATVGIGETESITIKIGTLDGAISSTTDQLVILNPFVLDHFTVTTPSVVGVGASFDVAITARNKLGSPFSSFSTPNDAEVLVTASTASGTFTVQSPASGFTNGTLTLQASYSLAVVGMVVHVSVQTDSTIKGASNPIHIRTPSLAALQNFQLMGVPVAVGNIRLSWPLVPEAINVRVEEETSPGVYTQRAFFAGTLSFWYDTTVGNGTTHKYRVTILDAASATLFQHETIVTSLSAAGCTNIISAGTITTSELWTRTGSPYCITGAVTVDSGGRVQIERAALILIDPGASILFANGGELITEDTGSGLTIFSTSSTSSPPSPHAGVSLNSTASPTNFVPATDDYLSGSVLRHIYYDYGGRFSANVSFKVEDFIFRNNLSGALLVNTGTKGHISNGTFQNNRAVSGGAIAGKTSVLDIDSCIFEYNSSTHAGPGPSGGGAIANCDTLTNSYFIGNTAAFQGGAVRACGAISKSAFFKNSVTGDGGAQYGGNSSESYYYLNTATSRGGAIFTDGLGTFSKHNYFEKNHSTGTGGAIRNNSDGGGARNRYIKYNTFIENTADGKAAALYLFGASGLGDIIQVENSYFDRNQSQVESSLYIDNNFTTQVIDSMFTKATADPSASANIFFQTNGKFINSYFESAASDCPPAFIVGAENACDTVATNSFKTDAPFPLCSVTSPGVADPVGCVGPNWDKPIP